MPIEGKDGYRGTVVPSIVTVRATNNSSAHENATRSLVECPVEPPPPPPKHRTDTVLFVPVPLQWEERRQYVHNQFQREGWTDEQVVLFFVMGVPEPGIPNVTVPYARASYLHTSCRDEGDPPDRPDILSSTACKTYVAMQHIVQHYEARWVWKVDSDSYLNLRLFYQIVQPALPSMTRIFYGRLRLSVDRQDDLLLAHQPRTQALLGLIQFGQYMSGAGFMVSYDVADFIASVKIPPRQVWYEDVMMGLWLAPFEIQFVDGGGLFHEQSESTVEPGVDHVLVHRVRPEQWNSLDANGRFRSPVYDIYLRILHTPRYKIFNSSFFLNRFCDVVSWI